MTWLRFIHHLNFVSILHLRPSAIVAGFGCVVVLIYLYHLLLVLRHLCSSFSPSAACSIFTMTRASSSRQHQQTSPLLFIFRVLLLLFAVSTTTVTKAWTTTTPDVAIRRHVGAAFTSTNMFLSSSTSSSSSSTNDVIATASAKAASPPPTKLDFNMEQNEEDESDNAIVWDYEIPENAVIEIQPQAMRRLRELRQQQNSKNKGSNNNDDNDMQENAPLLLRMGVRSGGCSGLSYVMDFCSMDDIHEATDDDEDGTGGGDVIDKYMPDNIWCVVESMLYLYGLQLNYSTKLVGGGFQFINPNAEESCGCGSSFGV